jgi:hypothetical protein
MTIATILCIFFVRRVIFTVLAQEKGGDFGDLVKNVIFLLTYPKKILQNLQMWDFFCNFVCFMACGMACGFVP